MGGSHFTGHVLINPPRELLHFTHMPHSSPWLFILCVLSFYVFWFHHFASLFPAYISFLPRTALTFLPPVDISTWFPPHNNTDAFKPVLSGRPWKMGKCPFNTGCPLKMNFGCGQVHILLKSKYYNNIYGLDMATNLSIKRTENKSNSAMRRITVYLSFPPEREKALIEVRLCSFKTS